ncbi:MAG: PBSX family phage terminase large subunit [Candidatus Hodarchaeales archaeon]
MTISNAQVLFGKAVVEPFDPQDDWYGPYQGADWGFANDPTVLIRCWVTGSADSLERELYIEHEAYGIGVDINETPELFDSVPDARDYTTRADSARPETISHMKQHGYPRMESVKKSPGSVKDGVAHIRGYRRIVIHPRCKHAAEEARLWSYKKDAKTGDVLPILIDRHDHCWDATRYALEPLISRKGFYFA